MRRPAPDSTLGALSRRNGGDTVRVGGGADTGARGGSLHLGYRVSGASLLATIFRCRGGGGSRVEAEETARGISRGDGAVSLCTWMCEPHRSASLNTGSSACASYAGQGIETWVLFRPFVVTADEFSGNIDMVPCMLVLPCRFVTQRTVREVSRCGEGTSQRCKEGPRFTCCCPAEGFNIMSTLAESRCETSKHV